MCILSWLMVGTRWSCEYRQQDTERQWWKSHEPAGVVVECEPSVWRADDHDELLREEAAEGRVHNELG